MPEEDNENTKIHKMFEYIFFYRCTVHSDTYRVHSRTNKLILI